MSNIESILANIGVLNPIEKKKLAQAIVAGASDDGDVRIGAPSELDKTISAALEAETIEGGIKRLTQLTVLQAASDRRNWPLIESVKGQARRLGVTINDGELLEIQKIDAELRASGKASISERIEFKTKCRRLKLI
jgi:hypothetical protein